MSKVSKDFVTFLSPGTFFSESTEKSIDGWDIKKAQRMAEKITERYNSRPYGFYFTTRERGEDDLDSKVTKTSGIHYIDAMLESYETIVKRNDPKEQILRDNMRINNFKNVVTNKPGSKTYRFTMPFNDGDVIL